MKHARIVLDIAGIGDRFYHAGGFINEFDPAHAQFAVLDGNPAGLFEYFFLAAFPHKKLADIAENGMRAI
jgi:hypothetical protein